MFVAAALHLVIIGCFGATWDEPLHRAWGQQFGQVFRSLDLRLLERLPGDGLYYGPLYHWLNYSLARILNIGLGVPFVASNHVMNILTFALGCSGVYLMARRILSARGAVIAVALFALFPPLVAHAQSNPKDVPLMTALVFTWLASARAMEAGTVRSAVVAGVAFGCALAIKLSAVLVLPALFVGLAVRLTADGLTWTRVGEAAILASAFFGSSVTCVYLFWPTLWFDPALLSEALRFFADAFWPHRVLYLGVEYGARELPWHYTVFHLVAATPIPTLALVTAGLGVAACRIRRSAGLVEHSLLLSWLFLPLVATSTLDVVRYDGFRQYLFVLPALTILGAMGFEGITAAITTWWRGWTSALVAAVVFAWIAVDIAQVFPYAGSYLNPAVRALGPHLERQVELEYWGATYKEGVQWLNEHARPGAVVCVPIAGHLMTWYEVRPDLRPGCGGQQDYVMYFTRYAFLDDRFAFDGVDPVFAIERYASRLLVIYDLAPLKSSSHSSRR
jgi:hypothetical protein